MFRWWIAKVRTLLNILANWKGQVTSFRPFSYRITMSIKRSWVRKSCLRPATLFKMRLWRRFFPVNFAKFLRTLFLQSILGRLLLVFKKECLECIEHILGYLPKLNSVWGWFSMHIFRMFFCKNFPYITHKFWCLLKSASSANSAMADRGKRGGK